MKTLILSAVLLFSVVLNASATNADPINEKVAKTFSQVFKNVTEVSWNSVGEFFEATFVKATVKTRALFNAKGNLVQTIRYYDESKLPANVLYNVKNDYSKMSIWGVTEVSNDNGITYRIILRDAKKYIHLNVNDAGDTEVVNQYKRGDK